MPEKQFYRIVKLLMVVLLLIFAYFLPRICVDQAGKEKQNMQKDTVVDETTAESSEAAKKGTGQAGVIVLDPGHGGFDPGMVGVGGVEEKSINLQIARILADLLEEENFQVTLTRTDDGGLYDADTENKKAQDMQRRCAVIEQEKPLLTVSIHQNSYKDPSVYGPQVFYFEHSAEGKELAALIQNQLNTQLKIEKPRAIKANTNYYILKRSESVTVLVECAFLSNPQEAEKIQTEEYQKAVAAAIRDGILEYLGEK